GWRGTQPGHALHWQSGAARCVRRHIPGALSILKGAVPDRARGLGHMAPTYFRREPGIATPTAERLRTVLPVLVMAAVFGHPDEGRSVSRIGMPGTSPGMTSVKCDV